MCDYFFEAFFLFHSPDFAARKSTETYRPALGSSWFLGLPAKCILPGWMAFTP
jgi:hypothetical protein